jgi:hypothetical protein
MKPPKPTKRPVDDLADATPAVPKPDPLAEDDPELAVLGKVKVADLAEEPPSKVLDRVPEAKRSEAAKALQSRWKRMRQFVSGASDELDW